MLLTIKKIGINGEGIGYYNKKPVFVDGALIDEVIEIKDLKDFKTYYKANINKIIKRNKNRIKPKCFNYEYCGACELGQIKYEEALKIKKEIIKESALKYANIILNDFEIIPSDNIYGYRNELKMPIKEYEGKLYTGLYLKGSNSFKRINKCLVHDIELDNKRIEILDILNKLNVKAYSIDNKDGLRYLILRKIENKYQLKLIFGYKNKQDKYLNELSKILDLNSIVYSFNTNKDPLINFESSEVVYGKEYLKFKMNNFKFEISTDAFLQLNFNQATNVYNYISSLIDEGNVLDEEYSGIGIMSIMNAHKFNKVYSAEIMGPSLDSFKRNVRNNNIKNIKIGKGDASAHLSGINEKIDVLLVDPPRSGMDNKMINTILRKDIDVIIYMSCNPSTLFKNIDALKEKYQLVSFKAFDMHANTAHIESVSKLVRKE